MSGCKLRDTVTLPRHAMYSQRPVRAGIAVSFFVSVVLLSACRTTTPAVNPTPAETGFLDRSIDIGTTTHRYQVYVPSNYTPSREWPLVLFLHGAGERGYGGLSQTHVGLGRSIRFNPERWPAIVVFPQLPPGGNWSEVTEPIGMQALQATMDEFAIDTSRVYLTGLSMGGYGSLFLGSRHADRFAALVAICPTVGNGRGYPFLNGSSYEGAIEGTAQKLATLPVWLFHGEDDAVFSASISADLAQAMQDIGADIRYTEYADTGHNAWDPAYDTLDMITWLFQQRKTDHAPTDSPTLHH